MLMTFQSKSDECSIGKAVIERIREIGMTNLHGGWLEGAQRPASHNEIGLVNRVLLLSDGCANEGLTDVDHCQQVQSLADRGITTSTYGLGTHFNEELMVQ